MVAPSFANFTILTEPFYNQGKYYVTVQNPKTQTKRNVRWYSDAEYAKAYGRVEAPSRNLKAAKGFSKGPILVVRNHKAADTEWLKRSAARYAVGIGWYFPSTAILPLDAPSHWKYLLLGWNEIKDGDDSHCKKPTVIAEILRQKTVKKEYINIG